MFLHIVEGKFVEYQKKILSLFEHADQLDEHSEYYKIGKEYSIEDNINNYTVSITNLYNNFNFFII